MFSFLSLILACSTTIADTPAEEEKYSAYEINKINAFLDGIKKLGYKEAKVAGWDNENNIAATGLVTANNKHDYTRTTEISEDADGATIFFRTYRSCTITTKPLEMKLIDKIITVDGQRIQTKYMCSTLPNEPGTQEIYMIKNPDGQAFIQHAFLNQKFVFVKLHGLEVPFSTKGFSGLWEKMNKPAL
jgi:hypothetical protein